MNEVVNSRNGRRTKSRRKCRGTVAICFFPHWLRFILLVIQESSGRKLPFLYLGIKGIQVSCWGWEICTLILMEEPSFSVWAEPGPAAYNGQGFKYTWTPPETFCSQVPNIPVHISFPGWIGRKSITWLSWGPYVFEDKQVLGLYRAQWNGPLFFQGLLQYTHMSPGREHQFRKRNKRDRVF